MQSIWTQTPRHQQYGGGGRGGGSHCADKATDRQESTATGSTFSLDRKQAHTQTDSTSKTKPRECSEADLPLASEHPPSSHYQQHILQSLGHRFTQLFVPILGAVLHAKPYMH